MVKENKVSIHNRLFFKLYLNYAVMLLITALLIGLIFIRLYDDSIVETYQEQLQNQAKNISERMSKFIINGQYDEALDYVFYSKEISGSDDIWTVPNPDASIPMNSAMATNTYGEIAESGEVLDYEKLLKSAFDGIPMIKSGYDKIYEAETVTVAQPVYGINREVSGAVLLKMMVNNKKIVVRDSITLIIISSLVALTISFIISIISAQGLSSPISRIRVTASQLARGNYHIKTGINRKDEIGDLAKTVDVLSEKLLENDEERKNLEQMRMDFFANVSHELRTPITVVRAYTETLLDGFVTDEETKVQYYDRMLNECKSMERLVGDLMILAKMQNPDFLIEKEPVNLLQIIDDIMRSGKAMADKKNIKIVVSKESPVYMVEGDYDRLRQMFMVILDNAIKFSDENKSIGIELIKKENTIKVSIRDEGVGIEPKDLEHIFTKFYSSNLKQNEEGTGLGLTIAKQIAIKHGAEIDVKSVIGEGTEFVFTFPQLVMEDKRYQEEKVERP